MADQLIAIIPSFSLSDSKSEYVPVGPPGGTPIKWYSELDVTLTFINPSIFKKTDGSFYVRSDIRIKHRPNQYYIVDGETKKEYSDATLQGFTTIRVGSSPTYPIDYRSPNGYSESASKYTKDILVTQEFILDKYSKEINISFYSRHRADGVFSGTTYMADCYPFATKIVKVNALPTLTLTSNNQTLTENQRINIGSNDFTVNITANDADPDDTLQYQVKLKNVVKKAWTAISKNQPVSYTFKNADITAGVTPFTVSVRDDKGNQTDFNGYLDKSWLVEDITSSVEIRGAKLYEIGMLRGSTFGSTKSEIRRRSDGSIYLLLSFTYRLSPKDSNGKDYPLYFERITPYPETYHPKASRIVTTGGNITKIEHTITGNTITFSADIPPTLIGKTITNLQNDSEHWTPTQEFFSNANYSSFTSSDARFALKNNIVIKSSWFNTAPTLNVVSPPDNQTLTENATLNIQGTASDADKDNVVTIKYRINNGTTRALQSGVSNGSTPLSFAKTLTFRTKRLYDGTTDLTGSDLAENTDHTLTIWAEDDQGGKSTEVTRKFRVVHNRPPVISGQNVDLGVLSAIPSKTYTVTEPEGDAFTIKEKVNGKIIRTFAGTASKENTATIPLDTWLQLSLTAVHTLTIEATDSKGMTSIRTYTFRRSADKIAFALKKPFDTDIAAKRILVTVDATVPAGADYKVEVCNNAFDESPTWEDTTNHVKFNRGFIFTNKEKTAEKWGVSLRFSFTKGTAAEPVIVRGFGGAFD